MDIKARRKGRTAAGRRANGSELQSRVDSLEKEVNSLALTDRVRALAARVSKLEETDSN